MMALYWNHQAGKKPLQVEAAMILFPFAFQAQRASSPARLVSRKLSTVIRKCLGCPRFLFYLSCFFPDGGATESLPPFHTWLLIRRFTRLPSPPVSILVI